MATLSAINWPEKFLPGLTDNFVSNEIIVQGISLADIWPFLVDTSKWESYYDNVSNITFPKGGGPELDKDLEFSFSTFGFPPLASKIIEFDPPSAMPKARISWHCEQKGSPDEAFEVVHAWLIEDLTHDRVRILTQESQIGKPAKELAKQKPNPMLNGHQAWLDGIARVALEKKQKEIDEHPSLHPKVSK